MVDVKRILKPDGRFFVIEPWRTPFLVFAHAVTELSIMRKLYAKGDALAVMTERERVTYENWLGRAGLIRDTIERLIQLESWKTTWGELAAVAEPS